MARSKKQGLDYPSWNPQNATLSKFSRDFRTRYKALRNSSSGFIQKADVRELILSKCNHRCIECSAETNLQVDHIISVYKVAKENNGFHFLNSYDNLTILCRSCNSKKLP